MEAKGGIMRIGIDLDNTILSYTGLFHALAAEFGWIDAGCPVQKDAIKDSLKRVARSDGLGELRWQRLQARVYGPDIDRAPLFDGFAEFVAMAREKGWALVIVSHKTEVSNLDPTVNLRRHARRTLAERGFFDSVERGGFGFTQADVYFENERIDKVRTIARLSLTHFIDDMPQVLEHEHFPRNTQPILCHDLARATHGPLLHLKDWHAVRDYFTWAPALADFNRARLLSIAPLAEGGNNRIFKLETASGPPITLKRYHRDPADPRPRRQSEWRFLTHLWRRGARNIPHPLTQTEGALFEGYIEGKRPDLSQQDVADQFLEMLKTLERAGDQIGDAEIGPAADARLRLADFSAAFARRWREVEQACAADPALAVAAAFLREELAPLADMARANFTAACSARGLDPEAILSPPLRFLSPSDFGPHNALQDGSGRVYFLDFEYAGWDDPAKLMADFLRHVGHDAPVHDRLRLLRAFAESRPRDPALWDRFSAVADLVGVEWILIVLNVTVPHLRRRKLQANPGQTAEALIVARLQRAQRMTRDFHPLAELLVESTPLA